MKARTTDQDMSVYREADVAKEQRDKKWGELRDLSMQHKVTLHWDLNDEAMQDKVFMMRVDDYEIYLDSEQVMRLLRWV